MTTKMIQAAFSVLIEVLRWAAKEADKQAKEARDKGNSNEEDFFRNQGVSFGAMALRVLGLEKEFHSMEMDFPGGEKPKATFPYPRGKQNTALAVKFADGEEIQERYASGTFVRSLCKMDLDKVATLGVILNGEPLVSTKEGRYASHKVGGYYVATTASTANKKAILEGVASALDIVISVQIIRR